MPWVRPPVVVDAAAIAEAVASISPGASKMNDYSINLDSIRLSTTHFSTEHTLRPQLVERGAIQTKEIREDGFRVGSEAWDRRAD